MGGGAPKLRLKMSVVAQGTVKPWMWLRLSRSADSRHLYIEDRPVPSNQDRVNFAQLRICKCV